jgi:hypothetical protein
MSSLLIPVPMGFSASATASSFPDVEIEASNIKILIPLV